MFERFKQGVTQRPTGAEKQTSDQQYHAVSIVVPSGACSAAKALIGKRFLATEAPIFPVINCSAPSCSCRYRHHDDRREDSRREQETGLEKPPPAKDDRRADAGRREEDRCGSSEPADATVDYFIYVSSG